MAEQVEAGDGNLATTGPPRRAFQILYFNNAELMFYSKLVLWAAFILYFLMNFKRWMTIEERVSNVDEKLSDLAHHLDKIMLNALLSKIVK